MSDGLAVPGAGPGVLQSEADLTAAITVAEAEADLRGFLPQGEVWRGPEGSRLQRTLRALAEPAATRQNADSELIEEADPRTTYALLRAWEAEVGEPDPCAGPADTLQERRQRVVQRLTARGCQSVGYFGSLAASLGYEVEILEYRPFIAGASVCGDILEAGPEGDGHSTRFVWTVDVPGPRLTEFRAGTSTCGERLGVFARAEDLECALRRASPAHTILIFSYKGV
ncbi:YmfQ family protein [Adonisia turfae]